MTLETDSASMRNGNLSSDAMLIRSDAMECTVKTHNCNLGQGRLCRFRHIYSMRAFVAFAGIMMCAQSALAIYSKSVLTSIERRFGISSSLAGFIVGSFNIGNLLFVVAVSKLSGSGHRPRIMGAGSLLIALGGLVNFVPHLVNEPYQPSNETDAYDVENYSGSSTPYPYLFIVLILGEILQGIGATVHIPLSSSYIDDYASKDNSPVYLGISFVLQNIGPGFGYLIGSWTSTIYVDFDRVPSDSIPVSRDNKTQWVGAWWLGYLFISAWVIIAALPLFFFPKAMTKRKRVQNCDAEEANGQRHSHEILFVDDTEAKKLGFCEDFWLTVKRLVTNPTYTLIVFGYSGLMFVVGALTAFMPKFLEIAFRKSAGSANLTFGLAVPPCLCVGLLSGGIIVKKCQWKRSGILKFVVISGAISLFPIAFSTLIHCTGSDECGNSLVITNLSLVNHNLSLTGVATTTEKMCGQPDCFTSSIIFVVIMSLGAMLTANMVTPIYTVVLRSVDPADKCTAIGVMFLIIRILGLVPAPIITGAVIDETCIKWNEVNGEKTNCLLYDDNQFRIRYLTLILLGILSSVAFNGAALLSVRRREHSDDKQRTKIISKVLPRCFKKSSDSSVEEGSRPVSV